MSPDRDIWAPWLTAGLVTIILVGLAVILASTVASTPSPASEYRVSQPQITDVSARRRHRHVRRHRHAPRKAKETVLAKPAPAAEELLETCCWPPLSDQDRREWDYPDPAEPLPEPILVRKVPAIPVDETPWAHTQAGKSTILASVLLIIVALFGGVALTARAYPYGGAL